MDLRYYFFVTRRKQVEFSKKCNIGQYPLNALVHKKKRATLLDALKIYFESDKQVSLLDMLDDDEKKELNKLYSVFNEVTL